MKKIFSFILLAAGALLYGADDPFNGGFEVCVPDKTGTPLPHNWISNRAVTRNGKARLTRESGCFRSGSFGLLTETEEKGCLSFRSFKTVPVKPGEFIEMEIWAKGSGKYVLQYIVYATDDPKRSVFLTTAGTGKPQTASDDDWKKHAVNVKFVPPPKAKGKYSSFSILPVIYVYADAEILFDDFALKITPAQ